MFVVTRTQYKNSQRLTSQLCCEDAISWQVERQSQQNTAAKAGLARMNGVTFSGLIGIEKFQWLTGGSTI